MLDQFGRDISYLRISVTELCNLRCRYCMPREGVAKKAHHQLLTQEETVQAAAAAASLGIEKLRITGGEPLVKRDIVSLCRRVAEVPGIKELCMTTNGLLLPQLAEPLRQAGVKRLNLSLDTLDPEKYRHITRLGDLADFYKGFEAALKAGFDKIKLNCVLMGGFNDGEVPALAELTRSYPVDVRFIELMPMPGGVLPGSYVSCDRVLELLPEAVAEHRGTEVARHYRLPGAQGSIGLIRPISDHFCGSCNRLRLTADGYLKPCLHSGREVCIKGMTQEEMTRAMAQVIWSKPRWHGALDENHPSRAGRGMNEIGG